MQLELRVHTRRSGPGDEAGYLKFGKQTFSTSSYSSAFITVQTLGCLKNFKPSPTLQEDSSGNQCSLYLWASAGLQLVFRLFLGWPPRCCVRRLPQKWPDIEMKYHRRQKQEMHWHCRRSCQGQILISYVPKCSTQGFSFESLGSRVQETKRCSVRKMLASVDELEAPRVAIHVTVVTFGHSHVKSIVKSATSHRDGAFGQSSSS